VTGRRKGGSAGLQITIFVLKLGGGGGRGKDGEWVGGRGCTDRVLTREVGLGGDGGFHSSRRGTTLFIGEVGNTGLRLWRTLYKAGWDQGGWERDGGMVSKGIVFVEGCFLGGEKKKKHTERSRKTGNYLSQVQGGGTSGKAILPRKKRGEREKQTAK